MDKITIRAMDFKKEVSPIPDGPRYFIEAEVRDLGCVSDGYHTIAELYDHRITLYIALARHYKPKWQFPESNNDQEFVVWRSKFHSDGNPAYEGWFIMGIGHKKGEQVTYHIPNSRWDDTSFAETLDKAPEWDGHTSADVLERLKTL